jgi:TRAP-type C4-dicarboxylate transport system permease small subunit
VEPPHLQTPYSYGVANKKPVAAPEPTPPSRVQRVLGFMVASIVGLAIIAIAAILIGYGTSTNDGTGVWQVVDLIPGIALPIGFILLVVLLIITFTRRARADKVAGK